MFGRRQKDGFRLSLQVEGIEGMLRDLEQQVESPEEAKSSQTYSRKRNSISLAIGTNKRWEPFSFLSSVA